MKKKLVGRICILVFIVVIIIAGLNFYAINKIDKRNNFNRIFSSSVPIEANRYHPKAYIKGIAGINQNQLYFYGTEPNLLIVTDLSLKQPKTVHIPLNVNREIKSTFQTSIHFPIVYILASNVPAIYSYNLQNGKVSEHKMPNTFTRGVFINSSTAVIRGFDTTQSNQIFSRHQLSTSNTIPENAITEKMDDGGFAADGLLNYDSLNNKLVYVHFYSNKIEVIDTSLLFSNPFHTIDTFSDYQVKAGKLTQNGTKKAFGFKSPPRMINGYCYVDSGVLYVLSKVNADNEHGKIFQQNAVIDKYDIKTKHYLESFYIPLVNGEKLRKFKVFNKLFVAVYANYIVTYKI